jgi:hypothetical protein
MEPESIRDLQRRRRDSTRARTEIEAILAAPDDDDEEEDESPPGPPPSKVWILFQATEWKDPAGDLRESDTIVGVFGSEEAARTRAAQMNRETAAAAGQGDAWYQPYNVES